MGKIYVRGKRMGWRQGNTPIEEDTGVFFAATVLFVYDKYLELCVVRRLRCTHVFRRSAGGDEGEN